MNDTALLELVATAAKELNYPTQGDFAYALWRYSNSTLSPKFASIVMREAGYEAFQGYPLTRRQK